IVDNLPTAVNRPSLLCRESTACPVCREARRHAPPMGQARDRHKVWKMGVHGADAGASEGRLVAPSSQPIPTAPPPHSPIDGKRTVLYGGAPPTTCATLARRR